MDSCNKIPPEQLLLAAATITIALSKDKSVEELESLVNLFNLIEDMMISILTQKAINQKSLSVGDVIIE